GHPGPGRGPEARPPPDPRQSRQRPPRPDAQGGLHLGLPERRGDGAAQAAPPGRLGHRGPGRALRATGHLLRDGGALREGLETARMDVGWGHVALAGAWGALVSLERRAFLQAMFSRPLVAATGMGLLLGQLQTGLYLGMILELFYLGTASLG